MWGGIKQGILAIWRTPLIGKPFVLIAAILLANLAHYSIALFVFRSLCNTPQPPPINWSKVSGGVDMANDERFLNCTSFCPGFLFSDHFDFVDVLWKEGLGRDNLIDIIRVDPRYETKHGYWPVRLSLGSVASDNCTKIYLRLTTNKADEVCVSPITDEMKSKYRLVIGKSKDLQSSILFPMISRSINGKLVDLDDEKEIVKSLTYNICCTYLEYLANKATIKTWVGSGKKCQVSNDLQTFLRDAERGYRGRTTPISEGAGL